MATTLMIMVAWYASGLLGAWLMWKVDGHIMRERRSCPTPRMIALSLIGGIAGPLLLIIALGVGTLDWLVNAKPRDSWWTRPICKREDD